ncbi:hypothetical protein BJV74DRAFT_851711 [Russula compacta]|nr:hypothetical protein BJV74DRAFT_851711 [Russula compacta]
MSKASHAVQVKLGVLFFHVLSPRDLSLGTVCRGRGRVRSQVRAHRVLFLSWGTHCGAGYLAGEPGRLAPITYEQPERR